MTAATREAKRLELLAALKNENHLTPAAELEDQRSTG